MNITSLISHPELLDKATLYELRNLIALYPYYQPARVLLLKNLFLLHEPTFDEELRRAAVYITDRRVLFDIVEGVHYQLIQKKNDAHKSQDATLKKDDAAPEDRTTSLIDSFLDQIPEDYDDASGSSSSSEKPTVADATVDYVAYLLKAESSTPSSEEQQLKGQELIDNFINNDGGKITLHREEDDALDKEDENVPQEDESNDAEDAGYFTETLARIYIKQGRYSKALEIITRLNLDYPKKNRYFADQIRFLEKLIINNNKK